tara:strand:+ start:643 stop:2028 length:1386 start_codon:yes stop_codon:yes gene_type:complete
MNVLNNFIVFLFLFLSNLIFSQNNQNITCQIDDDFIDTNYFVVERSAQISSSDLRKKLVESIINYISVESRLELENINELSSSKFYQSSITKSEGLLFNAKEKLCNNGSVIVYVKKSDFNNTFLSNFKNKLSVTEKTASDLLSNKNFSGSNYFSERYNLLKNDLDDLNLFLPFAENISSSSFGFRLKSIYEKLSKIEFYLVSIDENISNLERYYLNLDCVTAKNQYITLENLLSNESKIKYKTRLNILNSKIKRRCKILKKAELKEARENSNLFNNFGFGFFAQTVPLDLSNNIESNEINFDFNSFFISAKTQYLLGFGDSGLRAGPYLNYYFVDGTLTNSNESNDFFDKNFGIAGLSLKLRFIRNFIDLEFSAGKTLKSFEYSTNSNNIEEFYFYIFSPRFIIGNTEKRISFSASVDFMTPNNSEVSYKYLSANIGINYNLQFKKLKSQDRKVIKEKYIQ